VLINEFVALPSRIGIVAASVANAFGVDADAIRHVRVGDFQATQARMTAMAVAASIFAPGSLQQIAAHFGTTADIILDAVDMTEARCEFSDEFSQTWRLLLAAAIGLIAPPQDEKAQDEKEQVSCAA